MTRSKIFAGLFASTILVAACSQTAATQAPATTGASTAPAASVAASEAASSQAGAKPAPFDAGPVKIAMVRQSGAGDYFQQWGGGADAQAKAIGFEMQVYDAQADNATQATQMQTAIDSGVAGIIVDHGLADTMNPLIKTALDKGIPVVVYDVETVDPRVIHTTQSDADMAKKVLDVMTTDMGSGAQVGYVNVLGIAPLDRRDVVYQEVKKANGWVEKFFVGKFTNAVATDNAVLVDAALKANPDVKGIFAPYDELTKGTLAGIKNNGLGAQIKVYGIDISNADIELMTADASPWVATAATDPAGVGAAVVRAMALKLAGQLEGTDFQFPAALITQDYLKTNNVANMDQLRTLMPELAEASQMTADWIEVKY
ncbi:MAG TPA: substrate-binding domain-containing protein [Candidatus Limnocylindrales bacterium]|jgi:simple sugar transport system substrate-binding protein